MLIRSTFRDYYDGVQATGVDRTCVYVRRPRAVALSGVDLSGAYPPAPERRLHADGLLGYGRGADRSVLAYYTIGRIGFCGRFLTYGALYVGRPEGYYYVPEQRRYQYLSGVLGDVRERDGTAMTEREQVRRHGFDERYGFRTRPGGGKKLKRARK